MTELSRAAKAVLDAVCENTEPDCDTQHLIAAALRAAADQVVPEEPLHGGDQRWYFERDTRQACRKQLLAIATELENINA
jgi:hypothetical protein